jgi:hypothetical protein
MATARLTIGSVLGTVNTAAETLTGIIGTVSNGVGMVNAYVEEAAKKQQGRIKNDQAIFITQLVIEGAEAEAEMHRGVINYCSKSSDHKRLFETAYDKYAKLHGLKLESDEESNVHHLVAAE